MSNGYILRSGGGSGIDFSVSNYASKEKLPAIAKENSFAIISDIPAKEYILSGVKPNANSVGDIWCNTSGGENQFSYNALKRNRLIITPTEFFQWNGEAWIYKLSYVFKGGQWISLERFLISGGERTSFLPELAIDGGGKHKIFFKEGYVSFFNIGSGDSSMHIRFGAINFAEFKKIFIEYSTETNPLMTSAEIQFIGGGSSRPTATIPLSKGLEDKKIFSYDISEIQGVSGSTPDDRSVFTSISASIKTPGSGGTESEKLRIYNMWLGGVSK